MRSLLGNACRTQHIETTHEMRWLVKHGHIAQSCSSELASAPRSSLEELQEQWVLDREELRSLSIQYEQVECPELLHRVSLKMDEGVRFWSGLVERGILVFDVSWRAWMPGQIKEHASFGSQK